MKQIKQEKLTLFAMMVLAVSCAVNPYTGRKQLTLVDSATVNQLASSEYNKVKQTSKTLSPATNAQAAMVTRVGSRIAKGITDYYTSKGLGQNLTTLKWEYMLIDDKTVNAWCMPGGKIAVYTGLLPVTQNEDALAVVLGHEVAHAIAEHGKERMSQGLVQQLGGVALAVALSSKPAETQALFMSAYGFGSEAGAILPFSRSNELEADRLGVVYCALAGYNPEEAIPLWKRMAAQGGGSNQPAFMSTHPTEDSRIKELEKKMPEAVEIYKAVKAGKPIPQQPAVVPASAGKTAG